MAKTYKNIRLTAEEEPNFELDLSPMLALMVCLIPIMLLSTVFVKVTVIESPLPQVVQKAIEEDRKKKEREVEVNVTMLNSKSIQLQVSVDGKTQTKREFKVTNQDWNFDGLRKELIKVKKTHPKVFRLSLFPGEQVPYDQIVKLMDTVRNTGDENIKLMVIDEETKEAAETDIMFPDVIFGNLLEG